ncbi:hypothetical protein C5S32_09260 [ANME-1 cluster archaeon GoMg1]|nr:hypothetical protein [ANME-1 cluster archaeon GoMg1]
MFILLAVTPVLAQPVKVVVNAPEYVEEGETFDATIDVDNIINFNAGQFDLSFDSSVVKVSFKAKGEEGDRSVLEISNGQLINNKTEEIPANWIGTEIRIGEGEEEEEEEVPLPDSLAISLEPGEHKLEFSVHPGESVSKELVLANSRDFSAYNISHTPVIGNATDMISIEPELIEEIEADEVEKFVINVSVPKDQELGNYTAYSYFLFSSDGFPPPMPFKVDFLVYIVPVEMYGIDLRIDGEDDVIVKNVTNNETASFKITVKNTGMCFDVMQIEEPEFEDSKGWTVKLYDDAKEVSTFPHGILINAGKKHDLMLNVTGTMPGTNLTVEITGRSSANVTKMDSIRAITYIIKPKEEVVNVPKVEP